MYEREREIVLIEALSGRGWGLKNDNQLHSLTAETNPLKLEERIWSFEYFCESSKKIIANVNNRNTHRYAF